MEKQFKAIPGSQPVIKESALTGKASKDEEIIVGVRLRARPSAARRKNFFENIGSQRPIEKEHYSIKQLESAFGADPEDVEKVIKFAKEFKIDVIDVDLSLRMVSLRGTPKEFEAAFQVNLEMFEHPKHKFRSHRGEIHIPEELHVIVKDVLGLDTQFGIEPRAPKAPDFGALPKVTAEEAKKRYSPQQIAKVYNFPKGAAGKGQSIAIIALGGGYKKSDIKYYLQKIEKVKIPKITDISILGAKNTPDVKENSIQDFEIVMDLEIIASIANEADIAVYFAPNTAHGLVKALGAAIFDKKRQNSVISMSWGQTEYKWKKSLVKDVNSLLKAAAALGITVCLPSGDFGSGDDSGQGGAHVEFPSSSPYALCCGGTKLSIEDGAKKNETIWKEFGLGRWWATGGGVSDLFPKLPQYQSGAGITLKSVNSPNNQGRSVPDVASIAGTPGFNLHMNKIPTPLPGGDTSAAAPLWAALIALLNESLNCRLGYINPLIYQKAKSCAAFNDISTGNNDISKVGGYKANSGWDPCTGWGSPNGEELLKLFKGE